MKWKVMISAPYMQPVIDRFMDIFSAHDIELTIPPVMERMEEDELLEWIGDVDGAICGDDRFSEKVLRSAPKLKVISKWGTGIDSIDRVCCQKLNIAVCNTPNAFSEPVADSVMGYILCFARKLPWMDIDMHKGCWDKIPGRALRECTLGIVGVGNVGKAVARRAASFGMNLVGSDPMRMPEEFLAVTRIRMMSTHELLRLADFVSLNCDLNPTSFHLIEARAIALMKPSAIIINTARGPIIDEPALIDALRAKQIAGAALDVFENEPLSVDNPLCRMSNVMMAPHNANSSPEAWEHVHRNSINNLIDVLERSSQ
ncbi:MAG: phosphoglycerate dehydrogenase [Thermodesulfobacteriota bacterium]